MTPIAIRHSARGLALRVLMECRKKDAFVQEILDRELCAASLASADRRLATHLVYGTLRRRATLDALLRPCVKRQPHQVEPWIWEALRLGASQLFLLSHIPPHAALNETVALAESDRRSRGFINGVLRALLPLMTQEEARSPGPDALPLTDGRYRKLGKAALPDPDASPVEYLAQAFSFPAWMTARWLDRFGWEECIRLGFWFAGPAPMILRVNALRVSRDDFLKRVGENAEARQHPQAVHWRTHRPVTEIPGYDDGLFVIQDESAMRVADAVCPQPGERVLDLCAVPGGKSTHLAELMKNRGIVVACDVAADKLDPLRETCCRLGLTNVEIHTLDADKEPPRGPFDAVLVDVPCSNTGVLGKRPEARWRLKPGDFRHLVALQTRLLQQGCDRVRPGGRIVYSTCSIEPEENEGVVQAVLQTRKDLSREAHEISIPGSSADGGYWCRLRRMA